MKPWYLRNSTTVIGLVMLVALFALLAIMGDGTNVLNGGVQ